MSEDFDQNKAAGSLDPGGVRRAWHWRWSLRRVLVVVALFSHLLVLAIWAWFAYGPTGLSKEVLRLEQELAAASLEGLIPPPSPSKLPPVGFPEDPAFLQLKSDLHAFEARALPFMGAFAFVATSRFTQMTTGFDLQSEGARGLPERPSPEILKRISQLVEEPMIQYSSGGFKGISPASFRRMELLVSEAGELERRILKLLPRVPESSEFRLTLLWRSKVHVIASVPLRGEKSSENLLEEVKLLLSDFQLMRSTGLIPVPLRQVLIDLWCISPSNAQACREEIMALLDATDEAYRETEWQHLKWQSLIMEQHRRVEYMLPHASYKAGEGVQHFFLNGALVKSFPWLFRPLIKNQFDTCAAALLRGDTEAANRAGSRLQALTKFSGLSIPFQGEYSDVWFGNSEKPLFRAARSSRITTLMRIVTAIGCFRAINGREPESLAELIPEFLSPNSPNLSFFQLLPMDVGPGNAPLDGDGRTQVGVVAWEIADGEAHEEARGYQSVDVYLPLRTDGYRELLDGLEAARSLDASSHPIKDSATSGAE